MKMLKVNIDYKTFVSQKWQTVELSSKKYFDLDIDEEPEYDSVPKFDDAFRYLNVDIQLISHTRVRVIDNTLSNSRIISSAFWNQGNNSITRRIDTELNTVVDTLIVISMKISENPSVWEILRIQEDDDVPIIELHSFITDQNDGTETEKKVYSESD